MVARKKLWTGRTKETNPIDFYLLGGLFFITATLPAPPPPWLVIKMADTVALVRNPDIGQVTLWR